MKNVVSGISILVHLACFACCLAMGCSLFCGCGRPSPKVKPLGRKLFVNEVVIKTTPVRNQGKSELCWAYAMLSTIESNHLAEGDSLTLSTDYVARCLIEEQARRRFLSSGRTAVSLRGMMPMLTDLLQRYGAEPYDAYYHNRGTDLFQCGINYSVLCRKVEQVVDASTTMEMATSHVDDLLDREIGYLPRIISLYSMEYTPQQLAQSMYLPGDYVALTSFTHHPFGQAFVLETPDNQFCDTFLNVPLDTLMARVERSLRRGHAVCWEGDISEPGFSFARGVAALPEGSGPTTQAARQQDFSRRLTTDDHCMELCGIAHDRQGRRFFIAKNSWGKDNPYGGFMYLSDDFLRMKTIAVMVPNE